MKQTMQEWLTSVGIDLNKNVDVFDAKHTVSRALTELTSKCKQASDVQIRGQMSITEWTLDEIMRREG